MTMTAPSLALLPRASALIGGERLGGMKQSGNGRLGGEEGLKEFLRVKNVWVNLAAPR